MRKLSPFALSVLLGMLLAPVILYAQGADPLAPPDFRAVGVNAIAALTPVLGVVVLWGLKLAWSKIPASILVFAAPVLGIVVNYVVSYLAGHVPSDPLAAAALGALAVYLREFATTIQTKGLSGPITPTRFGF